MKLPIFSRPLAAGLLAAFASAAHANCGTAFCLVNTHWETLGAPVDPGWQVDLRYEIIDQDRFWLGEREATAAEVLALGVGGQPNRTRNRNLVLNVDYVFDERTSLALRASYIDFELTRKLTPGVEVRADYRAWGDSELLLRRVVHESDDSSTGLAVGVKLPTGGTDRVGGIYVDGDYAADYGPLERGVQPGTGTTDGVLGVYHSRRLARDWSAYAQAFVRAARGQADGYHPGRRLSGDAGASWFGPSGWSVSAQLAYNDRHRDDGALAEPKSANTTVAASLGVAWAFLPELRAYLFYQHPLTRRTEGVQTVADGSWVGGVSLRF